MSIELQRQGIATELLPDEFSENESEISRKKREL